MIKFVSVKIIFVLIAIIVSINDIVLVNIIVSPYIFKQLPLYSTALAKLTQYGTQPGKIKVHALTCLPNFTGLWLPDAPVTKPNLNHSLVLTYYCTFIFMHTFWGEGRQGRGKKSLNITYRLAPICPSHLTNLLSHIYILAPFSGEGGGRKAGVKNP